MKEQPLLETGRLLFGNLPAYLLAGVTKTQTWIVDQV